MYTYIYLVLGIYFLGIWLGLFVTLKQKETRQEMIFLSMAGLILSPFVDALFFRDWYTPIAVLEGMVWGVPVKFESFLFGFTTCGVCGGLYQAFARCQFKPGQAKYIPPFHHQAIGVVLALALFYGLHLVLDVHSFTTSLIACTAMCGFFIWRRPDLFKPMLFTAMTMMVLSVVPYFFLFWASGTAHFYQQWQVGNLSGWHMAGLPLEEILWYGYAYAMFAGAWKCRVGAVAVRG